MHFKKFLRTIRFEGLELSTSPFTAQILKHQTRGEPISATNVENFLPTNPISLHMNDFTLEKTLMSAADVAKLLLLALVSIII